MQDPPPCWHGSQFRRGRASSVNVSKVENSELSRLQATSFIRGQKLSSSALLHSGRLQIYPRLTSELLPATAQDRGASVSRTRVEVRISSNFSPHNLSWTMAKQLWQPRLWKNAAMLWHHSLTIAYRGTSTGKTITRPHGLFAYSPSFLNS